MEYKGFTYTPTPKTAWDNLSMLEKSEMMKVAVRNGITDLKTIREKYNEFAEGGNIYDGKTEPTQKMVTTGGAGYVPPAIDVSKTKQGINKRLYRTISPLEASYSLLPALQSFLSNKEYDDTRDGINEEYPVGTVDAIWAKYLQVPERDRKYSDRLEKSNYSPSKGSNNDDYYKLPLQDYEKESLVNTARELPLYNNKVSKLLNNYALGEHTVGRGYDKRGEYASYFDVFDINPFNGKYGGINIPVVNKLDDIGIGKPVRIYDRIYLDDYYGVKEPTHATYLPEVTIYGNKRKDGGSIHITPSKKGTFTAAATKHGMGVQEFASKVLTNKDDYSPAMVKKANFARNAKHWKHGLGGKLNTYNYGNTFGGGGLFGNETVDTVASFLPVLGTAEDAYQFYKDPSWANAGWLAASLASDIFTGGMASRAIKAVRTANKAVDAANTANRAARRTWEAGKRANMRQSGSVRGADMRRMINSVGAAGATRNAAIKRANDALFEAGTSIGIDQGINNFVNAAQNDMLPTFGIQYEQKHGLGGNLFSGEENHNQQMQLGSKYWADQTIYHDWQNSTIDGGTLPEVVVIPTNDASWLFSDGRFKHNSRKPLADKYTRKVVSNYLSKFDNESAEDYNARISRLADVLDIRGVQFKKNDVKSGKLKGRAHYIDQSATAYIDSMKDIFAEVAHPWQYAKGNNNIEEEVGTGKYDSDSDPRGGTRYAYPDTVEGETHGFFEPALTEWIETGKISKSSPILNNELSRQKIKPKDRMEVADSASSWNRQAIERRLLANPDQLPLYKRIQYGLFDYPLLDKKKALGGNLFYGTSESKV